MSRVLVLYATAEGHTGRLAERIAQRLRSLGHAVEVQRAQPDAAIPEPGRYDGVIVGASVHYGRHPAFLRAQLRARRAALAATHGAFFSVSLSAGGPGAKPAAAQRYLETFLRQAGWRPPLTAAFGGAAQYSKYGPFKRLLMIAFIGLAGGDTDTSRDYDYTDWDAVRRFAESFAGALARA